MKKSELLFYEKRENMDELKEALKYALEITKAKSSTELFNELIPIFYASAFSDGQQYILNRLEEEKEQLC